MTMFGGALLFEIPIYRLSESHFYAEQEEEMRPHRLAMLRQGRTDEEARQLAFQTVRDRIWNYNDLAGWVAVEGFHNVVKSHLFWSTRRITRRPQSREFKFLGKFTETWIDHLEVGEIPKAVRSDLQRAMRVGPPTRGRHLDLRVYDRLCQHLDWRAAIAGT